MQLYPFTFPTYNFKDLDLSIITVLARPNRAITIRLRRTWGCSSIFFRLNGMFPIYPFLSTAITFFFLFHELGTAFRRWYFLERGSIESAPPTGGNVHWSKPYFYTRSGGRFGLARTYLVHHVARTFRSCNL